MVRGVHRFNINNFQCCSALSVLISPRGLLMVREYLLYYYRVDLNPDSDNLVEDTRRSLLLQSTILFRLHAQLALNFCQSDSTPGLRRGDRVQPTSARQLRASGAMRRGALLVIVYWRSNSSKHSTPLEQ